MSIPFEEIVTPQVATIGAAVFTAGISIQTMFLKWLVDRFDKLSQAIREQSHRTHDWLTDHEEKDMLRHEENLKRFEMISVALARLGHNGNTIRN